MKKLKKNVVIIGAGGHAMVILDCLTLTKIKVLGFLEKPSEKKLSFSKELPPILGTDIYLEKLSCKKVHLANGIGSIKSLQNRKEIYLRGKKFGFDFTSVFHPKAIISKSANISEGVQIFAGAIVQPNCKIGINSIVNTGAIIDHDCLIGEHVHIASGAVLSGGVSIGNETHIGAGAIVKQGVFIGDRCVVGAGAVVLKNVRSGEVVVGVPALPLPGNLS